MTTLTKVSNLVNHQLTLLHVALRSDNLTIARRQRYAAKIETLKEIYGLINGKIYEFKESES
jgi:hypothetical protein